MRNTWIIEAGFINLVEGGDFPVRSQYREKLHPLENSEFMRSLSSHR
jgi:hypothetical protein